MNISSLSKNDKFIIKSITIPGELGKRMAEMGINPGTKGVVVRKALLGSPIQIKILNYDLTLRKSEAIGVEVERGE